MSDQPQGDKPQAHTHRTRNDSLRAIHRALEIANPAVFGPP